MADLTTLNNESLIDLTVAGRKTGQPRSVKIWFVATNDKIYVTSGRGSDAQWIKNLKHTSTVRWQSGSTRLQGTATWLEGPHVQKNIFPLFFRKYFLARIFGWIGWYREAFAFAITPTEVNT